MKLILGSKSIGRKRVLEKWGYEFEVMASDIDEKAIRCENYDILPLLIARGKTQALLPKLKKKQFL